MFSKEDFPTLTNEAQFVLVNLLNDEMFSTLFCFQVKTLEGIHNTNDLTQTTKEEIYKITEQILLKRPELGVNISSIYYTISNLLYKQKIKCIVTKEDFDYMSFTPLVYTRLVIGMTFLDELLFREEDENIEEVYNTRATPITSKYFVQNERNELDDWNNREKGWERDNDIEFGRRISNITYLAKTNTDKMLKIGYEMSITSLTNKRREKKKRDSRDDRHNAKSEISRLESKYLYTKENKIKPSEKKFNYYNVQDMEEESDRANFGEKISLILTSKVYAKINKFVRVDTIGIGAIAIFYVISNLICSDIVQTE